jgi:HD-GYP domain-containing protein (c-di-GMP phosphodiesterase class II)
MTSVCGGSEDMRGKQVGSGPKSSWVGSDLEEAYLKMAGVLARAVEVRESYAQGHSERVALLSIELAVELCCPGDMIRRIQIAATLHDIGKIVIPDYILLKPGPLTPAEFCEIKRHPAAAVEILRHLDHFDDTLPLIESHHEWYNGQGYPNRLKGEEIPLGARIIAVADAYDAMTSPRPYRQRLTNEEAVQTLRDGAGIQWDPKVVDAFLRILERETRILQTLLVET